MARQGRAAGRLIASLLLIMVLAGCGGGLPPQAPPTPPTPPAPPDPVQVQLDAMSMEEKIGQLVLIGVDGQTLDEAARELIQVHHVGGIILFRDNMKSVSQTVAFVNALKAANGPNKVPLWLSLDQEGGRVNRTPPDYAKAPAMGVVGRSNHPDYAFEIGSLLGAQAKSLGFNLNYAPVLDVNSNPNNPVIGDRSFGDNPDLVSRLGLATMKGIQSQKVVPVVKHFPGHGDTSVDSHLDLPVVDKSLEGLRAFELRPFADAIQNGADVVMIAHLLLPQLDAQHPSSFSEAVITRLLREEMQFDGVVITDDMTMGAIAKHFDLGEAAVRSVNAGADIVMVAHDYKKARLVLEALKQAAASGVLTPERIDRSVYRILALKQKYQLSDEPVVEPDVAAINERLRRVMDRYIQSR